MSFARDFFAGVRVGNDSIRDGANYIKKGVNKVKHVGGVFEQAGVGSVGDVSAIAADVVGGELAVAADVGSVAVSDATKAVDSVLDDLERGLFGRTSRGMYDPHPVAIHTTVPHVVRPLPYSPGLSGAQQYKAETAVGAPVFTPASGAAPIGSVDFTAGFVAPKKPFIRPGTAIQ